ncbi:hypothetical protein SDC9_173106 [bioreactor metagenome]|uniref:Uncharacterized protein n=1 Tax=bioreactor metagenome TaxID=1076179 RepID=A0A645GI86_9ZZZZ
MGASSLSSKVRTDGTRGVGEGERDGVGAGERAVSATGVLAGAISARNGSATSKNKMQSAITPMRAMIAAIRISILCFGCFVCSVIEQPPFHTQWYYITIE